MNAPTKLAAFGLVLAAAFGAAFALGDAVGPIDDPPVDERAPAVDGNGGIHEGH